MTTFPCSQLPEVPPEWLGSSHKESSDRSGSALTGKPMDDGNGLANGQQPCAAPWLPVDGQPLSTIVGSFGATASSLAERPICRICHEGSGQEELLSPCECAGTLGTIHRSCLERWLSSSSSSFCELCHFQFSVKRKARPLLEWIRNPGLQQERRTLFGDMVCFLLITPLATISGWLCLRGAVDHLHFSSRLEAMGLIALTVALFTIYLFWTLVSLRYHCRLFNEWRQTNQRVVLVLPASQGVAKTQQSLIGPPPKKRHSKESLVRAAGLSKVADTAGATEMRLSTELQLP